MFYYNSMKKYIVIFVLSIFSFLAIADNTITQDDLNSVGKYNATSGINEFIKTYEKNNPELYFQLYTSEEYQQNFKEWLSQYFVASQLTPLEEQYKKVMAANSVEERKKFSWLLFFNIHKALARTDSFKLTEIETIDHSDTNDGSVKISPDNQYLEKAGNIYRKEKDGEWNLISSSPVEWQSQKVSMGPFSYDSKRLLAVANLKDLEGANYLATYEWRPESSWTLMSRKYLPQAHNTQTNNIRFSRDGSSAVYQSHGEYAVLNRLEGSYSWDRYLYNGPGRAGSKVIYYDGRLLVSTLKWGKLSIVEIDQSGDGTYKESVISLRDGLGGGFNLVRPQPNLYLAHAISPTGDYIMAYVDDFDPSYRKEMANHHLSLFEFTKNHQGLWVRKHQRLWIGHHMVAPNGGIMSPDGKTRIPSPVDSYYMRMWERSDNNNLINVGSLTRYYESSKGFSPESSLILSTITGDHIQIRGKNSEGQWIVKGKFHVPKLKQVSFTNDGTKLVTTTKDNITKIWTILPILDSLD